MTKQEEVTKALNEIFRAMHRNHGPFPMRYSKRPQRRQDLLFDLLAPTITQEEQREQEILWEPALV
jgi:hypothetical protein